MADPLAVRAFYACVTASFTTKTDLNTLIAAAYAALAGAQSVPPITAAELRLTADAANTKEVRLGDANLTTTNWGMSYAPEASDKFGVNRMSSIPLSNMYVMSEDGVTGVVLHLMVIPC